MCVKMSFNSKELASDLYRSLVYGASIHENNSHSVSNHLWNEAAVVGLAVYSATNNKWYALGAAGTDLFLRFEQSLYRSHGLKEDPKDSCYFLTKTVALLGTAVLARELIKYMM